MRGLKIILVGRIRKGFRKEAFDHYLKKVKTSTRVELVTVKDEKNGNIAWRLEKEGLGILERTDPRDYALVLDEKGKSFTSKGFALELKRREEDPGRVPCFILGGAYGLSDSVRSRADLLLSLGPMTMPHELAAVLLMEQIYRGQTIISGHPYHH